MRLLTADDTGLVKLVQAEKGTVLATCRKQDRKNAVSKLNMYNDKVGLDLM